MFSLLTTHILNLFLRPFYFQISSFSLLILICKEKLHLPLNCKKNIQFSFQQATGLGGQATKGHDASKIEDMEVVEDREIRVRFNADTAASMRWSFRPQQYEITVRSK